MVPLVAGLWASLAAVPSWPTSIQPTGSSSGFCHELFGRHRATQDGPPPPGRGATAAQVAARAGTTVSYRTVRYRGKYVRGDDPHFQVAEGFCFRSGLRLASRDPAPYSIAWFDGTLSSGLLRDGQAVVLFPSLFAREPVAELRVAARAEQAGQEIGLGPRPAPSHPEIPGHRYVASDRLVDDQYLGLWRRRRGPAETLIVMFSTAEHRRAVRQGIVGRLPLRLSTLRSFPELHGHWWEVTLVSEASIGRPVHILHYVWWPTQFRPLAQHRQR